MPTKVGTGYVDIVGNFAPLDRQIAGNRLGSRLKSMAKAGTVGLAAVGAASVKMAVDFEDSMQKVHNLVGVNSKVTEKWGQQLLRMAPKVGKSPQELADALYFVSSSGIKANKVLKTTKIAAEASALGLGETETVADALTSAMNAYAKSGLSARDATNVLIQTVKFGKLEADDLAQSIGRVIPVSSKLKVPFQDVGAALASMSLQGLDAAEATTALRAVFTSTLKPTDDAEKALGAVGLSAEKLRQSLQQKGTLATLQMLSDKFKGNEEQMARVFPNVRALVGAFNLTGDSAKTNAKIFADMRKGTDDLGKSWKDFKQTPAQQMRSAIAGIQASMTELGIKLLPHVATAFKDLTDVVTDKRLTTDEKISKLTSMIANAIADLAPKAAGAAVVVGAGIAKGVLNGFIHADVLGKAVIASAVIGFFGGKAAFIAIGRTLAAPILTAMGMELVTASGSTRFVGVGKTLSKNMSGALRLALPGAIAAIGVANIIDSAVKGDTKKAAFKGAGAAIGAALGAATGAGLPGALAGAGLGSIVGGFMSDLFKDDDTHFHIRGIQHRLKVLTRERKHALSSEQGAAKQFEASSRQLARARDREHKATQRVHRIEQQLHQARKRYPPDAQQIVTLESRLARARHRASQAAKDEKTAERVHGVQADALRTKLRKLLRTDNERVVTTRRALRQAQEQFRSDRRQHVVGKQRQQDASRVLQLNKSLGRAQHQLHDDERKTAALGPRVSKQLINQAQAAGKTKDAVDRLDDFLHNKYTRTLEHLGAPTRDNVEQIGKLNIKLGNTRQQAISLTRRGLNPYLQKQEQAATKTQATGRATDQLASKHLPLLKRKSDDTGRSVIGDFKNLAKVVTGKAGLGKIEDALNAALRALGVKKGIRFGTTSGGKQDGKQRGGMVGAQGGMMLPPVPGTGSGDKVLFQAMVEPGEIPFILNRNASGMLMALNNMIPRFQTGGTGGMHPGITRLIKTVINRYGGSMSSGFRPGDPGFHGRGEAADWVGGDWTGASRFINSIGPRLLEGIHQAPPGLNVSWDSGHRVPPSFWGASTWAEHVSHIHMAISDAASGKFGPAAQQIARVLLHGPMGAMLTTGQGTLDRARSAANQYLAEHAPTLGSELLGMVPTGPIQKMARAMVEQIWGAGQWPPFASLEQQEAGWNPKAVNPSSGAAGLAQALPPSKYPPGAWPYTGLNSAKLQLQWMMGYIRDRYGNPAGAWAHEQSAGWYQRGGLVKRLQGGGFAGKVGGGGAVLDLRSILHDIGTAAAKGKDPGKVRSRVIDRIRGMGLPDKLRNRIRNLSTTSEIYGARADMASSLTGTDEGATPAKILNHTEIDWLGGTEGFQGQLQVLFALRNRLIIAEHWLLHRKHAMDRWLRLAKTLKGDLKKRVGKVRKAIKDVADRIKRIKEQLKDAKGDLRKRLTDALHEALGRQQTLQGIALPYFLAQSSALGPITEAIKTRRGSISDSLGGVRDQLLDVQGIGSPDKTMQHLPAVGVLGGQIFDVQMRLRDLKAPTDTGTDTADDQSDIIAALQDQLQQLRQGEIVRTFTTQLGEDLANYLGAPYAGVFHGGGPIPGHIGQERTITALAGEEVTPIGGGSGAMVIIQDGAVNADRIRILSRREQEAALSRYRRSSGKVVVG